VSAEPIDYLAEDPRDPQWILRKLPERERAEFLRQYRGAVDAARDPAGYADLQRVLQVWSLAVVATNQPGYYETVEAVRAGAVTTVPIDAVIPDWQKRAAVARRGHRSV
jgi:hypothetical protein